MAVNLDKPQRWKSDIAASVDFYNEWFMRFAPKAYRDTRVETTKQVKQALETTHNLTDISPQILEQNPSVLSILRMATAPPIARDRLIGLAGVASNLVNNMETKSRMPPRMAKKQARIELDKRSNISVKQASQTGVNQVNIPIDVVIKPLQSQPDEFPLLIEAKSAGDFSNTNKRRKEEATKVTQLRNTFGDKIRFVLFLCGYFDSGYLGYEAAEGIDWVWEHRIDDLANFGL